MIIDKILFSRHLEQGEDILYAVHKHWIEAVKPTLEMGFFGILLPWTLYFIGLNTALFFWISVFWSACASIRFFYILIDWYSDAWLVTSMSIITIEWSGIFSNNSARLGYEDIEGAAYEIKGFGGTILRYGSMTLRMMSGSHAELKNVSSPKRAELAIARFQDQYLSDRNMQDTDSLKALLSSLVASHNRNK